MDREWLFLMGSVAKNIGQRIRNCRKSKGWSQEKLAELSGCHPTYIGQLERGEKNATIESLERITNALDISLSKLLENINGKEDNSINIPLACYELLISKTQAAQEQLYTILLEIDKYKNN